MDVSGIHVYSTGSLSVPCEDEEARLIALRLLAYGERPTGNKTIDRDRLHQIELKEAKLLNYTTNKFLTVSRTEQEKIQKRKKEFHKESNPEINQAYKENFTGANALGEQVYLAINMNNKKQSAKKDSSRSS